MLNRCLPHFVTSTMGWSKLDILREILMSHTKKNSIDLHKNLTSRMKKNQYVLFIYLFFLQFEQEKEIK